jgi:serine/threonine-protein kinase RsbW
MKELTVPASLDSLASVGDFVHNVAQMAGLDEQDSYRLRLAVHEIATNVIVHGYAGQRAAGCLDLSAAIDVYTVRIELVDTAVPFDPGEAPLPDDFDKPLCQRRIGGLGLFIARQSVAEWRYERVGECNRNIFIVARPPCHES